MFFEGIRILRCGQGRKKVSEMSLERQPKSKSTSEAH